MNEALSQADNRNLSSPRLRMGPITESGSPALSVAVGRSKGYPVTM